jgi:uncharacterized protein
MKCPNCIAVDLLMTERKGIEIDYCPSCRGVWLDRGELDKFIQQTEQQMPYLAPQVPPPAPQRSYGESAPRYDSDDDDDRRYKEQNYESREYHDSNRQHPRYGKKKESFWGELFDFD